MSNKQFVERCPILAPGVLDELDPWGNFLVRHYDGRLFNENGDEIFDNDEDDDDDDD